MAVVQISRIQIRRGRKNTGSGIPQLASGELGWAVDSQELYIGNGAVSEGSPAVGNTKILTTNDDLFALADQYTYVTGTTVQTGATVSGPIKRTLQQRLDDIVSIRSFGGTGDGTDHTSILQRAIDQLYINTSTKGTTVSRVKLHLEAGTYTLSGTIKLPPYVSLVGAGVGKTIIRQTGNFDIFQTVNSTSTPGNYADDSSSTSLNQAQNISLEAMTIENQNTSYNALKLVSCKDSLFRDLHIKGAWTTGTGIADSDTAITFDNLSSVVGCTNNVFDNVRIEGFGYGVRTDDDAHENKWTNCIFESLGIGVHFGENTVVGSQAQLTGPERNVFSDCIFKNIDRNAIIFQTGQHNTSSHNKFYNIGNNGGTSTAVAYTIIKSFQDMNKSIGDWFSRTKELMLDVAFNNVPYISELEGPIHQTYEYTNKISTGQQNVFETIFRLPGDFTRTYEIDYVFKSEQVNAMRQGKLEVIVNKTTNTVTYSDVYDYNGESSFAQTMELKAQLFDFNSDTVFDTVSIRMKNTVSTENATLSYKVTVKN